MKRRALVFIALAALVTSACFHRGVRGRGSRGSSGGGIAALFGIIAGVAEVAGAVADVVHEVKERRAQGSLEANGYAAYAPPPPPPVPALDRPFRAYEERCGALPKTAARVSECELRMPNAHGASELCAYFCIDHCAYHDPAANVHLH